MKTEAKPAVEKKEEKSKKTEEKPKKTEEKILSAEEKLITSKLNKDGQDMKGFLRSIKKGSEEKKLKNAAKKWLLSHCEVALDAQGQISVSLKRD